MLESLLPGVETPPLSCSGGPWAKTGPPTVTRQVTVRTIRIAASLLMRFEVISNRQIGALH